MMMNRQESAMIRGDNAVSRGGTYCEITRLLRGWRGLCGVSLGCAGGGGGGKAVSLPFVLQQHASEAIRFGLRRLHRLGGSDPDDTLRARRSRKGTHPIPIALAEAVRDETEQVRCLNVHGKP